MSLTLDNNPKYGIAALGVLSQYWRKEITPTKRYSDLQQRKAALDGLLAPGGTNLIGELVNGNPKDWQKSVKAAAEHEAQSRIVADGVQRAKNIIDQQLTAELKSGAMYDHIMSQLDVEEAVEKFTAAAQALGPLVNNQIKAVRDDLHQEANDYQRTGLQLLALTRLDCVRGKYGNLALFASVEPLPRLEFRLKSHGHEKLYSDDDYKQHNIVASAASDARSPDFITEVARGKHPAVNRLDVALTYEEFSRRLSIISSAGDKVQVPK